MGPPETVQGTKTQKYDFCVVVFVQEKRQVIEWRVAAEQVVRVVKLFWRLSGNSCALQSSLLGSWFTLRCYAGYATYRLMSPLIFRTLGSFTLLYSDGLLSIKSGQCKR